MQLYLEDVIFDEFVINFFLLFLTQFALRQKILILRTILSSILGCGVSVLFTFFVFPDFVLILLKLVLGFVMVAIIVRSFSFKSLILYFLVFVSFTFLLGGFCFFIIYLFGGEVYSLTLMTYNLPISLGLITILMFVYIYFLTNLIRLFYKKQRIEGFYKSVTIKVSNKKHKLKAYLDSGNLLIDKRTKLPIVVISLKTFLNIFSGKTTILDFINGKLDNKIDGEYIVCFSVSGKTNMFVFKPDEFCVDMGEKTKNSQVLIGVSNFDNKKFDILLNPLCI